MRLLTALGTSRPNRLPRRRKSELRADLTEPTRHPNSAQILELEYSTKLVPAPLPYSENEAQLLSMYIFSEHIRSFGYFICCTNTPWIACVFARRARHEAEAEAEVLDTLHSPDAMYSHEPPAPGTLHNACLCTRLPFQSALHGVVEAGGCHHQGYGSSQ